MSQELDGVREGERVKDGAASPAAARNVTVKILLQVVVAVPSDVNADYAADSLAFTCTTTDGDIEIQSVEALECNALGEKTA